MITSADWNRFVPENNPFLKFEFFDALISSGSIGPETGWSPLLFKTQEGLAPLYEKTHSYGEYIFDWSWAEAFERYGEQYYPKLTSMVPFTPVTTSHFILKKFSETICEELLNQIENAYQEGPYSSLHFLFLTSREKEFFEKKNYLIRETFQYHFQNSGYRDFQDFLSDLKSKKAKQLRKERMFTDLRIEQYTGNGLTPDHAKRMYRYYTSTLTTKGSFPYLNEKFFVLVFQNMKNNVLFVEATKANAPVAGSIFFYDQSTLYGRYWGSFAHVPFLHFELCYYQGIDFCLKNKLQCFEAGAQGEHKITRGFRPVSVFSAHKIKSPPFQEAISLFIKQEKAHVEALIEDLSKALPFKASR